MKLLTMTIVFWLGTNVAEDKRTCRSEDQNLHHEIIQSFKKDFAEWLGLELLTLVVSKGESSVGEVAASLKTFCYVCFQFLCNSLSAYTETREQLEM